MKNEEKFLRSINMKKAIFFAILTFLASFICAQTLDATIGVAATEVSGRLPRGSTVVMIEFETNSEELANHVIDEMNHNLVTIGAIRPVERRRLNTIRSELSLNVQGEVSDDFAQRIGHMLGAQHIILGSITSTGNQYILRFRAITTETATIVWSFSQNIRSDTVLENFLKRSQTAAVPSGSGQAITGGTAQAAVEASALQVYKIGDTGPAGGLIFFDKGSDSGGWRYLEAAPASTEIKDIQWSVSVFNTGANGIEPGTGKLNTRNIMDASVQAAVNAPAARYCDRLQHGGYNDWYLPSRNELGLMYMNLKVDGLGGFGGGWYWSSTQSSEHRTHVQNFNNGGQDAQWKTESRSVRAIRQF